jgi:hypothetical protein
VLADGITDQLSRTLLPAKSFATLDFLSNANAQPRSQKQNDARNLRFSRRLQADALHRAALVKSRDSIQPPRSSSPR